MAYDNSKSVYDAARRVVKLHSLLRDRAIREFHPTFKNSLDALTNEIATINAQQESPFEVVDLTEADPMKRNYVGDLTARLRVRYSHGKFSYSTQLRISDAMATASAEETDWTEGALHDYLQPFVSLFSQLNTTYGFSDFSVTGCDVAMKGGSFVPCAGTVVIVPGTKTPSDYSLLERSVTFRCEGLSRHSVGGKEQALRTSLSFSGFEIATDTDNSDYDDCRITKTENIQLVGKVTDMNGIYLGVTGDPVYWKPYINVYNAQIQDKAR